MPLFYKGARSGTHLHVNDPRTYGIQARDTSILPHVDILMRHIAGNTHSPYISVTRSYAVAEMYARDAARTMAAVTNYVFEIDIPATLPPGVAVQDPILEIANSNYLQDTLADPSYHHQGDRNFINAIVNPIAFSHYLTKLYSRPPGVGSRPTAASNQLEAIVRAARDAELLVVGAIPRGWVIARHDVN